MEQGELGLANIKKNLAYLKVQESLMKQAEAASTPSEKVKLISQAAELPIEPPTNFLSTIRKLTPMDEEGYIKRHEFSARDFIEEQMQTIDGFVNRNVYNDPVSIEKACKKIAEDKTLKDIDRQTVLCLVPGVKHRAFISSRYVINDIKSMAKVDDDSRLGLLSDALAVLWKQSANASREEKTKLEKLKKEFKEKQKNWSTIKKDNDTRDRRSSDRYTIE